MLTINKNIAFGLSDYCFLLDDGNEILFVPSNVGGNFYNFSQGNLLLSRESFFLNGNKIGRVKRYFLGLFCNYRSFIVYDKEYTFVETPREKITGK